MAHRKHGLHVRTDDSLSFPTLDQTAGPTVRGLNFGRIQSWQAQTVKRWMHRDADRPTADGRTPHQGPSSMSTSFTAPETPTVASDIRLQCHT